MKYLAIFGALTALSACADNAADRDFATRDACPDISPHLIGNEGYMVRCIPQERFLPSSTVMTETGAAMMAPISGAVIFEQEIVVMGGDLES